MGDGIPEKWLPFVAKLTETATCMSRVYQVCCITLHDYALLNHASVIRAFYPVLISRTQSMLMGKVDLTVTKPFLYGPLGLTQAPTEVCPTSSGGFKRDAWPGSMRSPPKKRWASAERTDTTTLTVHECTPNQICKNPFHIWVFFCDSVAVNALVSLTVRSLFEALFYYSVQLFCFIICHFWFAGAFNAVYIHGAD